MASVSADAQETGLVDAWQIAQTGTGCLATYASPDKDVSARLSRSYRFPERETLYLTYTMPRQITTDTIRLFKLYVDGESEALGEGRIIPRAGGENSAANIRLSNSAAARLKSASGQISLVLLTSGGQIGEFSLKTAAPVVEEFDACLARVSEDLMSRRAPAYSARSGPSAPVPQNDAGRWVTANDYPSRALRREEEGVTTARLSVSKYGFVKRCDIAASSGSSILDRATCRSMTRRAFFYPARDENDAATEGTFTQSVRWAIPE